MKRYLIALVLLVLLLAPGAAWAQEQLLPGVGVFSPGLVRLSEKMKESPAVHMEAGMRAEDAFYVRDTSVLNRMLSAATFVYDGAQGESGWTDCLKILCAGEPVFTGALTQERLVINGEAFALGGEATAEQMRMQKLLTFVQETAILERAPLREVEAFLLSLEAGQALFGGYAVAEPFTSVQTMSDDGTRLTRINLSGSIAREGEAPWVIKGYLKQPAGRAPKDTFELTARRDEDNYLELTYSSIRESEITKKNRAGKMSVDTHMKIAGKIEGYSVREQLKSYLRNSWTADGETLSEKVIVNITLDHSDNTPGREMQRLNDATANMRHEIRLTTADAGNDVIDLTDAITLSVVMDGNTMLDVAADAEITVGAQAETIPLVQTTGKTQSLDEAIERAAMHAAREFYAQLGEETREKIADGLE